jgi:hypothetical protein
VKSGAGRRVYRPARVFKGADSRSRALELGSPPQAGQRGLNSRLLHRDHVLDLAELDFLDSLDFHDVFDRLERPGVDDRLSSHGADTGEDIELVLRRVIDVDLLACLL